MSQKPNHFVFKLPLKQLCVIHHCTKVNSLMPLLDYKIEDEQLKVAILCTCEIPSDITELGKSFIGASEWKERSIPYIPLNKYLDSKEFKALKIKALLNIKA
jgi:hypothetical protein